MRILILSANTGEGHNSAARALKERIEARGGSCRIEDGLAYMGKSSNALICKGHVFFYRSLPKVYGVGYRFEERAGRAGSAISRNCAPRCAGAGAESCRRDGAACANCSRARRTTR